MARRTHDEKLAKMEKQREDARRKMENRYDLHRILIGDTRRSNLIFSKNIQLLNFSSKDDHQKQRPWLASSNKNMLTRQLSSVETSTAPKMKSDTLSMNEKNFVHADSFPTYQRSISIDHTTTEGYSARANRALSVEPSCLSSGNEMRYLYQQTSLPTGSTNEFDDSISMNRACASSSETMDQST